MFVHIFQCLWKWRASDNIDKSDCNFKVKNYYWVSVDQRSVGLRSRPTNCQRFDCHTWTWCVCYSRSALSHISMVCMLQLVGSVTHEHGVYATVGRLCQTAHVWTARILTSGDSSWIVSQTVSVTVKDDEEVKSVTQQFCEWVASLGGDSNNIDEATITSLFASGYETKPALSVPIHVVELANVPPELRLSATMLPETPPQPATTRPRSLGCARVCYCQSYM